jgi:two-component system osmolarity sensor histidine kinase EnvZ
LKAQFDSLYFRTAAALFLGILAIGVLLLVIGWLWVSGPLAQQSATDFAKLIHNAANTYYSLPEPERAAFRKRLQQVHALTLEPASGRLSGATPRLPYLHYLEITLSSLAGKPVPLFRQDELYRLDFPVRDTTLRFRFSHDRIGTSPGVALGVMALVAILASLLAALFLARRMTRPIELIADRSDRLSHGRQAAPIPEEGPPELRDIARNFNTMTTQNRELLDSRATMLAGISHDLRAPITRARMALELARYSMEEALALRIERSLLQMESLIAQYLDFSAAGAKEAGVHLSIPSLLKEVAQTFKSDDIHFDITENVVYLPSRAFIRCAQNLLDNAVKHGAGTPIDVHFHKSDSTWVLEIADRGPGIPDHQIDLVFQPFRRLDNARTQTGSGLGLAIVQEISHAQGWFISLLPRTDGGLIARLSIPIAAQN